jgi:acyl-coenzyme A synthetase/AMP-(fatty) acid ligase
LPKTVTVTDSYGSTECGAMAGNSINEKLYGPPFEYVEGSLCKPWPGNEMITLNEKGEVA